MARDEPRPASRGLPSRGPRSPAYMLGLSRPAARMSEGSPARIGEQERPRWSAADLLTAIRLPLAVAFPLASGPELRFAILLAAAGSDLLDGTVARRYGASRLGAVLDPIADKLFMASAFGVVAFSGRLAWWEVAAVAHPRHRGDHRLCRDRHPGPPERDPGPPRRQGGYHRPGVDAGRLPARVVAAAPARLGHSRGRAVCDLGLHPGVRPGAPSGRLLSSKAGIRTG